MKATEKEIKDYIYKLFMFSDLDWYGYLELKKFEKQCINHTDYPQERGLLT